MRAWHEYRYPLVMAVLQRAALDFAQERRATGQLGFEDLLLLTARLLRGNPAVRDEVGERFRYLLVDEFQDTDPIQAEVCFLLASPSSEGRDWRRATPRQGSLFVVGDPKQSIYRFRRADIEVYESVKRRMKEFGTVLSLTSNFRSTHGIGAMVNAHFKVIFPAEASAEQAPFGAMHTVKGGPSKPAVGYYRFEYPKRGNGGNEGVVEHDAALVASLIADRIEREGAKPGDFLILTGGKWPVASYARALSHHNIPVVTTGACLPQEQELTELVAVLRAIADPDNGILVVAALEGLFFGLSPADLWDAKELGLRFAVSHAPTDATHKAGGALLQLHEWWKLSQRHPADVLLEQILSDTGLLFHATSQELGDVRAGTLLHIIEVLRSVSTSGASGISDALERLDALLEEPADDASLMPGQSDAVRVMNVHQAKGLEAETVILAAPVDESDHPPRVHIRRSEQGEATGGLCLGYKDNGRFVTLAQSVGWEEMQAAESRYGAAEDERLLYVAATRARKELIVAQFVDVQMKCTKPDSSIWRPLASVVEELGSRLDIVMRATEGRRLVERDTASITAATDEASRSVATRSAPAFTVRTVTESAKGVDDETEPYLSKPTSAGRGVAWGRAVHRVFEALLRGRRGDRLQAFALAVARDEKLDVTTQAELSALAGAAEGSDTVQTLTSGGPVFAELAVMRHVPGEGTANVTEGVIDAAALHDGTWQVVDWKTDVVEENEWTRRELKYAKQVGAYGEILTELSGYPATSTVERVR